MGNEINYAEVFGLTEAELSAEVGEQEQEVAAPAEETQDPPVDSEKEQEVADPATGEEEEEAETEVEDTPVQTREERARNAAARRKAEQEELIARVRAEEQEKARAALEQEQIGQHYGRMNPYTGKPILTKADLDEYTAAYQAEEREAALAAGNLDMKTLNAVIENHPMVQRAKLAMEKIEQQEREARQKEGKARLDAEIAQIGKMDARVKSLADISKLEKAGEIIDRVKRGYSFLDAYRLEYEDKRQGALAGAAKKAAVQAVASKAHMKPHDSRGGGGVEIPKDEMEMYRLFNPGVPDEEILRHAAKAAGK